MELPGLCPGVWSTEAANKFIEALLQDRQKEKENCGEFAAAAAAAAPSAAVAAAAAAPASSASPASGQSAGGGQRTLDDALPEHAARARQLEEQNPEPSPMPRTVYKCSVCGLPKAGHTCSGVWQGDTSEAPKQPLASCSAEGSHMMRMTSLVPPWGPSPSPWSPLVPSALHQCQPSGSSRGRPGMT